MGRRLNPETLIRREPASLIRELAGRIALRAEAAVRDHGAFYLTLSGGESPRPLYEALAHQSEPKVPWGQVDVFWNDERMVPPGHPESNFGLAEKTLLSRVPLARGHIHRILGESAEPMDAALAYEHELHDHFPADKFGEVPTTFDLLLLGIGPDGHTASLFPGDSGSIETGRWVTPVPVAGEAPFVPRVSLTISAFNRARAAYFLVTGAAKSGIVRRVVEEHGSATAALPAARVEPLGELVYFLDGPAASELPKSSGAN
ncbi:MAG: 6-phosphogluconolactonase [Thermoplasmata archaeon]|nr:6-phosphogluconolactonase [Thermoplasmata archaeon]